ncbi:MAG: hypothetical protein WC451_06485 [Patescibacteria group bacterium]|jgi:hypothetical protein
MCDFDGNKCCGQCDQPQERINQIDLLLDTLEELNWVFECGCLDENKNDCREYHHPDGGHISIIIRTGE